MPVKRTLTSGVAPVKIWTEDIEEYALKQLENMSRLPFIHKHIAVMPDVHWGRGSTIGSVIPTDSAIIPAAVGVDIGCGMAAVKTNLSASDLPESLREIRHSIERSVPLGASGMFGPERHVSIYRRNLFAPDAAMEIERLQAGTLKIREKHPQSISKRLRKDWQRQLGTLGAGNHFIEICLDQNQSVWVMLHSGSRGIGNQIGTYFIELAKEDMLRAGLEAPDKDLSYLREGTEYFQDYVEAVAWAQDFALANRKEMLENIFAALTQYFPQIAIDGDLAIHCHHNYVMRESHFGKEVYVTRKGAIRARDGDLGIIPGSMGAQSFIVRGKGNPESFNSCSHGAGRQFSRTHARRTFTTQDLENQTQGVECRKDKGILDEIPSAYKDIRQVMANQEDLAEILYTLKQILCVKGD